MKQLNEQSKPEGKMYTGCLAILMFLDARAGEKGKERSPLILTAGQRSLPAANECPSFCFSPQQHH